MPRRTVRPLLASALVMASLAALAGSPRGADQPASSSEAVTVVTHVDVLPPFTNAGRALLREYAASARKGPGATRVEIVEEVGRPNHSTIVSVWADRAAFDAHLAAEATRGFRNQLQPMLGSPFDERLHRAIRP